MYTGCTIMGLLSFIPILPTTVDALFGFVCVPMEYDFPSTMFMWLFFVPLYFGIPSMYVIYVFTNVLWRTLLPPRGGRPELAVYFFRIVFLPY